MDADDILKLDVRPAPAQPSIFTIREEDVGQSPFVVMYTFARKGVPLVDTDVATKKYVDDNAGVDKIPNTLFVDATNGNDTTAERENPEKPYATVKAANDAALVNDTIRVLAGAYTVADTEVLDGVVTWDFDLGAEVTFNGTGAGFTASVIKGQGKLTSARTDNSLFQVGTTEVECKEIITPAHGNALGTNRGQANILHIKAEKITTNGSISNAFYWNIDVKEWITSQPINFTYCNVNIRVFEQQSDNQLGLTLTDGNNATIVLVKGGRISLIVNTNNVVNVARIENAFATGKQAALEISNSSSNKLSTVNVGRVETPGGIFSQGAVNIKGACNLTIGNIEANDARRAIYIPANSRIQHALNLTVGYVSSTTIGLEIMANLQSSTTLPTHVGINIQIAKMEAPTGIKFDDLTYNAAKATFNISNTMVIADIPFAFDATKESYAGIVFSLSNVKLISTGTENSIKAIPNTADILIECSNVYVNKGIDSRIIPSGTLYLDRRLKP